MKHLYGILIVYLVLSQFGINALITIYNIGYQKMSYLPNSEATIINTNVKGFIEYAKPPDACTHIAIPKFKPANGMKNIVLINGTNNCDFMTKIRYAKEVGYKAIVLFNPFPGPFNYSDMTFPIPRSEIGISVVLVPYAVGSIIRNVYLYPNFWVTISPNDWIIDMVFAIVGFGGLAVIVGVFLLAVFLFIKLIIQKCRHKFDKSGTTPLLASTHDEDSSESTSSLRAASLGNQALERLPSVVKASNALIDVLVTVTSV